MKGNKKPVLLLITQSFPFGIVESSFLKEEIQFLAKCFDIHIVSRNVKDVQYVTVPTNVILHRYDAHEEYSILGLLLKAIFSIIFIKEVYSILLKKKNIFKSVFKSLRVQMRTLHFSNYLDSIRNEIGVRTILYSYWNDYASFAASLIKRQGDYLICRLHGGDLYELNINDYYQPYKCLYNQKVDWFSFISAKGLKYFCETYFDVSKKASVNFLGVPSHTIKYKFSKRTDVRLVSFSYVRDIKRIDKIIDTLSKIENVEVHWTHIGGRYLYDQVVEYANKKLVYKKNIDYKFVGEMKNEDALDYIASHEFDFLINVSSTEGMPMTMMEAFSMSLPVIGTAVGGVPEVVKHGYNGYLLKVDFGDDELIKLLSNYAILPFNDKVEFREHAKDTWRRNFYDVENYKKFTAFLMDKLNKN